MNKKIFSVLLFVFFTSCCLSVSFIPEFKHFPVEKFYLCITSDSNRFFLCEDMGDPMLRVQLSTGKIITYVPEYLNDYRYYDIEKSSGTEKRKKILKKEPLFIDVVNMKSYQENIVIVNSFYGSCMIQFVNKDFRVISSWEDNLPLPDSSWTYPKGEKVEPVALLREFNIAIAGEPGEILFFDKNGNVSKRLVVRNLFNITRVVDFNKIPKEPYRTYTLEGISYDYHQIKLDAKLATARLAARDKLLPSPIFIKGERFPQFIKAMESRDNGNIIILDGEMTDEERGKVKKGEMEYRYQILYELNPETAEIKVLQIPGFKLLRENAQLKKEKGDEIKDDPIWDDEEIVDIRCKNDILCILTSYRALTVEFEPELRVTGEYHFHFDDEKNNDVAWDVTYTKPVKFLIVNLRKHRIDEYQPVPEKVGTPLDRGFAEEKKKEEAEEAEEIRVLDEFEKRHQEEKKIIPVSEADKEAARELVDLFHERLIAGELDKIPDMLHNDFVSETSTTKRTYVKEVLPTMYSDIKEHDVIAKINSRIGESSYTNDTRSIIKSQIELIVIDKEGKVREFEKGKILFYFYFIKSKNGMQILEMDTKDRTERFKKDETEDEAE